MPRSRQALASAALAIGSAACASVGDFDIDRTIAEQRVMGSPIAGLLGSLFQVPIPLAVDIESEITARNTGPAETARLKALALEITTSAQSSGDSDDFDFLDSVDIFIESTHTGSHLPRARVARADNIAATPRIDFTVIRSVNVLPYAEEGARLTSEVEGRVPPDDVSFAGHFTLRVELF